MLCHESKSNSGLHLLLEHLEEKQRLRLQLDPLHGRTSGWKAGCPQPSGCFDWHLVPAGAEAHA